MKFKLFICAFFIGRIAVAQENVSHNYYQFPDSVQVIQFMTEIKMGGLSGNKEIYAGIQNDILNLFFELDENKKAIVFKFPTNATVLASGLHTETGSNEVKLFYDWTPKASYKLLLSSATDSAENFSLFSGYVFLPKENKWKLIGTCRIEGRSNSMLGLASFHSAEKLQASFTQVAIQRNTGSWKDVLKNQNMPAPMINWFGNVDSMERAQIETKTIEDSIRENRNDATRNEQGVYFKIIKMGAGQKITVNDTVIAYYKGYTFSDGKIFDQTKEGPATFPLKRLIRGWQLGIPLIEVGGKIKLVIPSGLAYSIRTRSPKIPPNSILVFEIEVVGIKPLL